MPPTRRTLPAGGIPVTRRSGKSRNRQSRPASTSSRPDNGKNKKESYIAVTLFPLMWYHQESNISFILPVNAWCIAF